MMYDLFYIKFMHGGFMRFSACLFLSFILPVFEVFATPRVEVGAVLGKAIFFEKPGVMVDTFGWNEVEKVWLTSGVSGGNNPKTSCKAFSAASKTWFRLKKPSAMSIVILHDLGYRVIALCQWNALPKAAMQIRASGMPDSYDQQHLITDFYWERLESYDIQKPIGIQDDFALTLKFTNGANSIFPGRNQVMDVSRQIVGTNDGLVLQFSNGSGEEQILKRKVFAIYICVDKPKKASAIIRDIENTMDSMKLDLSYGVPEVVEVKCE